MLFRDRSDAGGQLAVALEKYRGRNGVVYALPRGGVVTGVELARHLRMPLDLLFPRKLGHPTNSEYAIAALSESGELVSEEGAMADVDPGWLALAVARESREAQRRRKAYLGERSCPDVAGQLAILVDDGIATGLTMLAAILDVRALHPERIVVAIPVAPADTVRLLEQLVDEVVAVDAPEEYLGAISDYYQQFDQLGDEEVIALLASDADDAQA